MAHDPDLRAVRIHARRESSNPDVAIITLLPGNFLQHVRTADAESFSRTVRELGPRVALVEIPLAIRSGREAVQAVIVLPAGKSRQQYIALVNPRGKNTVAIDIGKNQKIRRLRNNDSVAKHGHAQRRSEPSFLQKNGAAVGHALTRGVFQNNDAVALRTTAAVSAIVYSFGHIEPPLGVKINVGRIVEQRRGCPQCHF